MSAQTALAERHRREQVSIRAAFLSPWSTLWRLLVLGNLRGTLPEWSQQAADLVLLHRALSAMAAVRYYDAHRALPVSPVPPPLPRIEGLPRRVERRLDVVDRRARRNPPPDPRSTRFRASPAPEPGRDDVRRRLTGAVVGRVAEQRRDGVVDLDRIGREALAESSRVASQLVLDGGRDALGQAIEHDPAAVAWARIVGPRPCAFCAMQASRGFVFKSRDTAGAKYHPGCACSSMPMLRGDPLELPAANAHLQDLWARATAGYSGADARRAWRRAIDAEQAGHDPVAAGQRDPGGQGRKGGRAAVEAERAERGSGDTPPRRRVKRSGAEQDAALRKRINHMEQTLGQLEDRLSGGEDIADVVDFHREELDRLRARVRGASPEEALAA